MLALFPAQSQEDDSKEDEESEESDGKALGELFFEPTLLADWVDNAAGKSAGDFADEDDARRACEPEEAAISTGWAFGTSVSESGSM